MSELNELEIFVTTRPNDWRMAIEQHRDDERGRRSMHQEQECMLLVEEKEIALSRSLRACCLLLIAS
jgi:hypothetical protein